MNLLVTLFIYSVILYNIIGHMMCISLDKLFKYALLADGYGILRYTPTGARFRGRERFGASPNREMYPRQGNVAASAPSGKHLPGRPTFTRRR